MAEKIYDRKLVEKDLKLLRRRQDHLGERIASNEANSYDREEYAVLGRVIPILEAHWHRAPPRRPRPTLSLPKGTSHALQR